jgi:hypothetical protein
MKLRIKKMMKQDMVKVKRDKMGTTDKIQGLGKTYSISFYNS